MKKILVLMMLFFSSYNMFAQNHIRFMGIPLGQELRIFVFKLEQKGFKADEFSNFVEAGMRKKYKGDDYNWHTMKGLFMGVNNQSIGIHYTDNNIVNIVAVSYNYKSWHSAYIQYSKLKSMLTQKYGKPNKCVETFPNPIPKDDRGKIKAIQTKKGKYVSTFNVNSGNIEISILCIEDNEPYVDLRYKDSSVKERKPIDDL